jgi:hypothetical protein
VHEPATGACHCARWARMSRRCSSSCPSIGR